MARLLNIAGYVAMSALGWTGTALAADPVSGGAAAVASCRLDGQGMPPGLAFSVRAGLGDDPATPRLVILPPTGIGEGVSHRNGEVMRAADGLFYVIAFVNGQPVRFLVDTGASAIVLTKGDAQRAGISADQAAFVEVADTAGGQAKMARVTLAQLTVAGTSSQAVPAVVAGDGLGVSLLGQSWLTRLDSVTIEGDRMVLR